MARKSIQEMEKYSLDKKIIKNLLAETENIENASNINTH
jgi:hypothetical protein